MKETTDANYRRGKRDAWLEMLKHCLGKLGYESLSDYVEDEVVQEEPKEEAKN